MPNCSIKCTDDLKGKRRCDGVFRSLLGFFFFSFRSTVQKSIRRLDWAHWIVYSVCSLHAELTDPDVPDGTFPQATWKEATENVWNVACWVNPEGDWTDVSILNTVQSGLNRWFIPREGMRQHRFSDSIMNAGCWSLHTHQPVSNL